MVIGESLERGTRVGCHLLSRYSPIARIERHQCVTVRACSSVRRSPPKTPLSTPSLARRSWWLTGTQWCGSWRRPQPMGRPPLHSATRAEGRHRWDVLKHRSTRLQRFIASRSGATSHPILELCDELWVERNSVCPAALRRHHSELDARLLGIAMAVAALKRLDFTSTQARSYRRRYRHRHRGCVQFGRPSAATFQSYEVEFHSSTLCDPTQVQITPCALRIRWGSSRGLR